LYVFGAGGTGGFALEFLSRLFAAAEKKVTIDIYDGDAVENKNLKRQNFTIDDLDKNKATALIQRLKRQVINPPTFVEHTSYVTDADDLEAELLMNTEDDETAIIVMAVDNIATRRLINQVIEHLSDSLSIIALDSGNNNQGGQVVIYANSQVKVTSIMGQDRYIRLPTMLQLYPEIDIIKDGRDENPGLSSYCAAESDAKPQAMMSNVRNGEILASLAYQVSQNEPIPYNVWQSSDLTNVTSTALWLSATKREGR
jgi:hypothetical protein